VIQASIKNIGNQSAGPSLAGIQRGPHYNADVTVGALEPGASSSVTFYLEYWEYYPGARLEVTADYEKVISECNEENNSLEFQEQVEPS
jgi:subtilase family serine protease